jgi:hypothetical protein
MAVIRQRRQLILKKKPADPSSGKLTKHSLQLFFMVCYDTRLILPELCFLRQALFGNNSILLNEVATFTKKREFIFLSIT